MQNFVRIFALSLVATGAFAATQINNASAQTAMLTQMSAMPMPLCPPDGTTSCGLGQRGNAMPMPLCPPDGTTSCGLGQRGNAMPMPLCPPDGTTSCGLGQRGQ